MRNFLVAKFKEESPVVSEFGIKDYPEKMFKEEFGDTDIPLPSRLYRGVLIEYAKSFKRAYKKLARRPKFHKYNPNKQSFYLPGQKLKIIENKIKLPSSNKYSVKGKSKIIVDDKDVKDLEVLELIEPRFMYKKGKWYVLGAKHLPEPKKKENSTIIGLDWGIKNFMTSSDGKFINYPKTVIREFYRISNLQKLRDKKIKNSNNWNKLNNKIILAYERLENLKKDFIEQTTTKLCKNNSIAIEDLTKAKIKTSNKNKRRMQIINPLTRFTTKLEWKCKKFGTDFYKVNPAYTTQTCSCCGNLMKLSLKDRVCNCSCGNNMDRDINAAINIAAKAVRSSL